jgi:oxygen-independent coproporphyrinogen-3 oxidase
LKPQRIALFGYAHVPWFKRRQRLINAEALPGVSERYDQAELARRVLCELGYESVGLDHFALPSDPLAAAARASFASQFSGYVESNAVLGFGLGHLSVPGGYAQTFTIGAWRQQLS